MAVLENHYKSNMTKEEAVALAKKAITAGIDNDLGSGSQVDVCIIENNGKFEHIRGAVPEQMLCVVPEPVGELPAKRERSGVNGFRTASVMQSQRQIQIHPNRNEDEWSHILGLR